MEITFYKFSGERVLVDKSSLLTSFTRRQNCTLKENTSILSPSILITVSSLNTNIFEYNYCYIPAFKRYYFVDDVVNESANLWRFNLSVDVLMSYKDFLFGQKALVTRNQYIDDYEHRLGGFQIDERMPFNNYYSIFTEKVQTLFYGIESIPIEPAWYCLTFFSEGAGWVPIGYDSKINPYGIFSHTVLIKTDRTRGTNQLLAEIIRTIVSDYEAVGSFVSSMFCIPYDCSRFISEPLDSIKIGNATIDLKPYQTHYEFVYSIKPKSVIPRIEMIIPNIKNYEQLPPYMEYRVNLPFVGLVDIPIEAFSTLYEGFRIWLDTIFDFTIGTVTYKLIYNADGTDVIYYETSVECMNPVPVSASNAGSINRAKDAYLASFIGQMVEAGLSSFGVAASYMSGNYGQAASGGAKIISTFVSSPIKAVYDLKKLVPSGTMQKSASIFGSFKIDVDSTDAAVINTDVSIITFKRAAVLGAADYYKLNGHVCQTIKTLSEVYGYTEIGDIHLEIRSILTEERDMLISLLTSGVIFPPKPT